MYKIIYRSTANPNLTSEDISNILNTARDFNKKHRITGCLIYYNHKFIQILEGEKIIVEELFSKIKMDKRHFDVELLVDIFRKERIFTNWSMAYLNLDSEDMNDKEHQSFKTNLITYSMLTDKSDIVSNIFWNEAKTILTKGKLF